jgi:magnesium chelatase subunit H
MIEAAGRGMWEASPEKIAQLKTLYADLDDQLEGV